MEVRITSDEAGGVLTTVDASATGHVCSIKPEYALKAVLDVTSHLGERLELPHLLSGVLDAVFDLYPHADEGVVLLLGDDGDLEPAAAKSRNGTATLTVHRGIVDSALESRQAVLAFDGPDAERSRSLMCVPLVSRHREPLGVLELHTEVESGKFTPN